MQRISNAVRSSSSSCLISVISLVALILGGSAPAHAQATPAATAQPAKIRVDFRVVKRGARHKVAIVLTNTTTKTIVGYHPHLQMAIGFIVLDALGNLVTPVGISKVSPKRQRIRGGILRTYPLAPTEQAVLFGAGRR